MDAKHAENELNYRLGKIVLATMLDEGLISQNEYDAVRKYLMEKLEPLIGSLEPPHGA